VECIYTHPLIIRKKSYPDLADKRSKIKDKSHIDPENKTKKNQGGKRRGSDQKCFSTRQEKKTPSWLQQ
jgi:hypothetical protein